MTNDRPSNNSNLDEAIEYYANALSVIKETNSNPSIQEFLKVILARDAVQEALSKKTKVSEQSIATLIELDSILKKKGETIAIFRKLEEWRSSLNPPQSAWWWFLQPKRIHRWQRFDWVWDAIAAVCLMFAGSFTLNTFQAFSSGGLSVAELFGTISQAAGLAVIGQGALTKDGQEKVKKILKKANIPEYLQSEAVAFLSLTLLGVTYTIHKSLPNVSNIYYGQGQKLYENGLLTAAEEKYKQAMQLDPNNVEINIALGEIYESLGSTEQALAQYKRAMEKGEPKGFNNAGRIYIEKDPVLAETLLHLGLQRVSNETNIQYQLHRNLGWALLSQKKYEDAEQELKAAIQLDKIITQDQIGGGMAYCLLAELYQIKANKQEALNNWNNCEKHARPETINEYKWFLQIGRNQLANKIDTTSVVANKNKPVNNEK